MAVYDLQFNIPADITRELNKIIGNLQGAAGGGSGSGGTGSGSGGIDTKELQQALKDLDELINRLSELSKGLQAPGNSKLDFVQGIIDMANKLKDINNTKIEFEFNIDTSQAIANLDALKEKFAEFEDLTNKDNSNSSGSGGSDKNKPPKIKAKDNWSSVNNAQLKSFGKIINSTSGQVGLVDRLAAFSGKYLNQDKNNAEIDKMVQRDMVFLNAKLNDWWTSKSNQISQSIDQISKANPNHNTSGYVSELRQLQQRFDSFLTGSASAKDYDVNEFNSIQSIAKQLSDVVSVRAKQSSKINDGKEIDRLNKLLTQVFTFRESNPRISNSQYGIQLSALEEEIRNYLNNKGWQSSDDPKRDFDALKGRFSEIMRMATQAGATGQSIASAISQSFVSGVARMFGAFNAYNIIGKFREMYNIVLEIDSSMTNLKRITTETADEYNKFLDGAASRAQKLGTTIKEIVDATTNFVRLGYSLQEASALADTAIMYRNVGEVDIDTATGDITSVLKAYDLAADQAEHIVDVFNILGDRFATTSAAVGAGLNRSASALRTANNSFEESAAMITAITEITQDSQSAGNALKTLSLRIRSTKTQLAELGEETDGAATTTSKLRNTLKGLTGVDIMRNADEYKSTYQIMGEIADVWYKLSDAEKAATIELLAGKTRANQVAALLNNWSQAEKALTTALNSNGIAAKENEQYLDSMLGRTQQLKASFEALSSNLIKSESAKYTLEILNGIVTALAEIGDGNVILPVIAAIGGLAASEKSAATNNVLLKDSFKNLIGSLRGVDKEFSLVTESEIEAIKAGKDLEEVQRKNALALSSKALAFNLVVAAITVALSAYAAYEQHQKELRENAIATAEALNEQAQEYSTNVESIKELKTQLDDSTLSQDEYNHVKGELVEIQDKIIDRYGQEAKAIDLVNGELDEEISKYRELRVEELKRGINDNAKQKSQAEKFLTNTGTISGVNIGTFGSKIEKLNKEETKNIERIAEELGFDKMYHNVNGVYTLGTNKFESMPEVYDALDKLKERLTEEYGVNNEIISEFVSEINETMNRDTPDILKSKEDPTAMMDFGDETYKQYTEFLQEDVKNRIELDDTLNDLNQQLSSEMSAYNQAINDGDKAKVNEVLDNITKLRAQIDQRVADVFSGDNNVVSKYYAEKYFDSIVDGIEVSEDKALEDFVKKVVNPEYSTDIAGYINKTNSAAKVKGYLENIVGNEEVDYFKKDLSELGYSIDDFVQALVRLGYLDEYTSLKYVTQSFAEIGEAAETATKATDTFASALGKIGNDNALSYDEVSKLLEIDPSLASSIERYKDGYTLSLDEITKARDKYISNIRESYKDEISENKRQIKALQKNSEDAKSQLEQGDLTQDRYEQAIKENEENIKNLEDETSIYEFLITHLSHSSETYSEIVAKTANNMKSNGELISKATSEMEEYGKVNAETALQIMGAMDNWQDILEYNEKNNSYGLKSSFNFEEVIKESSGYNAQLKSIESNIDSLKTRLTELKKAQGEALQNGRYGEATELGKEIDSVGVSLSDAETNMNLFINALEIMLGLASQNESLTKLNNKIKELDHNLAMGVLTEQEYYDKYAEIVNSAKENYDGNESDLWSFEEKDYANKVAAETKSYEKALRDLKALHDDYLIDDAAFAARKKALDEQYYGPNSFLGGTEDGQDKYFELKREQIQDDLKFQEDAYEKQKKLLSNNLKDRLITYDEYMVQMSALNEKYYGPNTMLGSRKEGKQKYEDNLREIQATNKEAFDYSIKQLDDALDLGKISVAQYWKMYGDYADKYLKNIPQLAEDYQAATKAVMTTGVKEQYEDDRKHLDRLFEQGKISLSAYLEECESMWAQYFKNKQAFEDEDYEKQKELQDQYKNGISTQIDALKHYADQTTKPLQDQIDVLNDIKDRQDDIYDKQIKKLQLQKTVIEERNKKEKQENDILKARNELLKAEMKTRLVYDGQGGYSLQRDEEKYQSALKDYREAERQEQVQKLDDQIDAINRLKDTFDTEISQEIKDINLEIKMQQEPFNEMVRILEDMLALESSQYDPEFVKKLLGSEAGKQAVSAYDARNELRRDLYKKYGSDEVYKDLFTAFKGTGNLNSLDPRYYMSTSDLKEWQKLQNNYGIYTLSGNADDYIKKYGMTANEAEIYKKLQKKYAVKNPYSIVSSADLEKQMAETAKKYNMTTDEFMALIGGPSSFDPYSDLAMSTLGKIMSVADNSGLDLVKPIRQSDKPKTSVPDSNENIGVVPLIDSPAFNIYVSENVNDATIAKIRTEASQMFVEFTNLVTEKISSKYTGSSSKTSA